MLGVIAMPVWNRPDYLEQALGCIQEALTYCSEDWEFSFGIEAKAPNKVYDLIHALPVPRVIKYNPIVYGIRRNVYCVLATAFAQKADVIVYLEDDVVVAPDVLKLVEAYYRSGHASDALASGLGFCSETSTNEFPNSLYIDKEVEGLMGNGFAITAKQWLQFYMPEFWRCVYYVDGCDYTLGTIATSHRRQFWRPRLNRSRNIGLFGTNATGTLDPVHNLSVATQIPTDYIWET